MPALRLHNLVYLFEMIRKGFDYSVGPTYRIKENFSDTIVRFALL